MKPDNLAKKPTVMKSWNTSSNHKNTHSSPNCSNIIHFFSHVFQQEQAKLAPGEKLSIEKTTSILLHIFRKARAQEKKPSQDSR